MPAEKRKKGRAKRRRNNDVKEAMKLTCLRTGDWHSQTGQKLRSDKWQ
jgi:hypothetical protein